jgi:hypothetical protein
MCEILRQEAQCAEMLQIVLNCVELRLLLPYLRLVVLALRALTVTTAGIKYFPLGYLSFELSNHNGGFFVFELELNDVTVLLPYERYQVLARRELF